MNKRPPMPPRGGFDGKPMKRKINFKTLGRTVKLLFKFYPVLVPITIVCILFSAVCGVLPAIFIQEIIEIIDNVQKAGLGWDEASRQIIPLMVTLGVFYVLSLTSITAHTQLMSYIT